MYILMPLPEFISQSWKEILRDWAIKSGSVLGRRLCSGHFFHASTTDTLICFHLIKSEPAVHINIIICGKLETSQQLKGSPPQPHNYIHLHRFLVRSTQTAALHKHVYHYANKQMATPLCMMLVLCWMSASHYRPIVHHQRRLVMQRGNN